MALNFAECGFLVNPNDSDEIVKSIQSYINNDDLFLQHSINARKIIETDKNWEKESIKLIALIESLKNFK